MGAYRASPCALGRPRERGGPTPKLRRPANPGQR
jgi:hypothetical protein